MQPRSQGLSSSRLGGKMRDPGNEVVRDENELRDDLAAPRSLPHLIRFQFFPDHLD